MMKKTLGRTGLEVSQLGYGSMGIRGSKTWGVRVVSEEAANEFLNSVLDAGINFIDPSPDFGISEQRNGRYISSRRANSIWQPSAAASTPNAKLTLRLTTSGRKR